MTQWTFLTNHLYVLLAISQDPTIRLRDVADKVGITERAAQRIVAELVDEGFLGRRRVGRRNVYKVHSGKRLRHPLGSEREIGEVLSVLS